MYGNPLVHPQTESYWGNVNPLFNDYKNQNKVQTKIVRIFNTYGPRMHPNDGRVVSNFIVQALRNQEITVYGNGEQTRDYIFVKDVVSALIKSSKMLRILTD